MLRVESLNQYYGGSHILRDVSFEIAAGRCTTLLGRNGVGKTTLLQAASWACCRRAPAASASKVRDITTPVAATSARALGIGYVPQGREIFPRLTVEENLQMGLATQAARRPRFPAKIFEMFPVLKEMLRRRGGDLSGGQQQQLAIGRALAMQPKLLILDEPTEGIQPSIIKDIERVIRALAARAATWRSCWSSSTTISRARSPTTIGDVARRMVKSGRGADMDAENVRSYVAV